jgi:hypothetical protein
VNIFWLIAEEEVREPLNVRRERPDEGILWPQVAKGGPWLTASKEMGLSGSPTANHLDTPL